MQESVEQFLEHVARRGSWVGGGSVAALSAALAAALLQKLVVDPKAVRMLRRLRRECLQLIQQDAETFARVIQATRTGRQGAVQRALKAATDIPCRVAQDARAIQAACHRLRRSIKPLFQSDLVCALSLAQAADRAAQALIRTNLAWLKDRIFAARIHRRLRGTV